MSTAVAPTSLKVPAAKAEPQTMQLYLQSSEGRLGLSVDPSVSFKEVKKLFKKAHPPLYDVNLNAFIVHYKGQYVTDENVTLKSLDVQPNATLILVKRATLPFLNAEDRE